MKKFHKIVRKLFKKHITRLFAISLILVFSISLIQAVGSVTQKVKKSSDNYYSEMNVSDLVIKSTLVTGFKAEEIQLMKNHFGEENISLQTFIEEGTKRFHFLDLTKNAINQLKLLEGNWPEEGEIVAERKTAFIKKYKIGDKVSLNGSNYTISGIVLNPYYFQNKEEPLFSDTTLNVEGIFYQNLNPYYPINDVYVKASYRTLDGISKKYMNQILVEKNWVINTLMHTEILTLKENASFHTIYSLSEKIGVISWILMIAFMVVSGLVILTTISRLIEEERTVTASLVTLGYQDKKIIGEYLLFTIVAIFLGAIISWPIGYYLTDLIYINFDQYFVMPKAASSIDNFHYFIAVLGMSMTGVLTCLFSCFQLTHEKPAELLRPKPPKASKPIFLEHIPFIWNHLSFKYKLTARNLFRDKKHFFMTVISIIGSTTLVFLASGLLSYSLSDELLGNALKFICVIILAFAGGLTAVIIYVLTNINISERKRELATFMVLGYYDYEVTGHIFREIYIMSFIAVLLGLPCGMGALSLIFHVLGFGAMDNVSWVVYVASPMIGLLFTFLVTFLLRKKITNIDMNESLKILE